MIGPYCLLMLCLLLAVLLWHIGIAIDAYVRYVRSAQALERAIEALFKDDGKRHDQREEKA